MSETTTSTENSVEKFATAYLAAIRSAESLEQGVRTANAYLQRRFAASITGDTIRPRTTAGEELHALTLGFDAEYDSYRIGHGLETVVTELYGETGSYYTPEEMVEFMVERTVHPQILDAIGRDADEWMSVDEWLRSAAEDDIVTALEETRALTVCDPACGSGHFLVGAHDELVRLKARFCDALGKDIPRWRLAKQAAENCIYGVDVVPEAVQMSKLRLRLNVLKHLPTQLAEQYVPRGRGVGDQTVSHQGGVSS